MFLRSFLGFLVVILLFGLVADVSGQLPQLQPPPPFVDLTGGSYNMVQPFSVNCANLAKELRVQYLVGYRPTNGVKDGKWRTLRVNVESPENGPKLKARVKRGYYTAKEAR